MELPKMITNPPIPTSVYKAMAQEEKYNELMDANEQQIKLLTEQNEQLKTNCNKLEDLYILKEQELEDVKQDAKKAKRYNTTMLIIALVSAGIALASLAVTILFALL